MQISPDQVILWHVGPFHLNATIAFTWLVMALMVIGARLITARLSSSEEMSRWQNLLEVLVTGLRDQIRDVSRQRHAPLGTEPRPGATAAIVFGSDHGLCGRFNEEIADLTWQRLRDLEVSPRACTMAAVGFRVASRLDARDVDLARVLELPGSAAGLTETVQTLAVDMDAWCEAHGVERILVFYNRRTDATFAQPRTQSLLPLAGEALDDIIGQGWPSRMLPVFSMDAERLLSALLREYLFVGLYRARAEPPRGDAGCGTEHRGEPGGGQRRVPPTSPTVDHRRNPRCRLRLRIAPVGA